ncbi:LysR family transcriptional regulator [Nannocystis sp. SCPEA4]|uniref:LysR family transcriptional regulator n=1 Tax=Nannocystis sp. SCPEA4 TaxID=2996787 RepID=UPI00226DC528|nr:LysR family transcriptional regulator [Nannocystis sp. SCPEA4]
MSASSVDLNLLLVLHTVLTERNVARAAERLHVTPSAVSNALARLRAALGDPLVTRKGRGIVPTPRALELAPGLARVVRELELMLSVAPLEPASCTRTFTLAVADLGQVVWSPLLAAAMRREMPLAHLRLVGIDTLVSLGDLSASEIDLHLGIPAKGPGIYAEPLLEERSVLVARRDHPVFDRRVTRRALGELRHVRVEMVPGKNFRDPFAATYARAGVPREVVMTVPSYTTAAEIVAASELVTMLPLSFLRARGEGLGLREVNAPLPAHATRIAMCWHERTHADPAARAFRALVRGVVKGRQRT